MTPPVKLVRRPVSILGVSLVHLVLRNLRLRIVQTAIRFSIIEVLQMSWIIYNIVEHHTNHIHLIVTRPLSQLQICGKKNGKKKIDERAQCQDEGAYPSPALWQSGHRRRYKCLTCYEDSEDCPEGWQNPANGQEYIPTADYSDSVCVEGLLRVRYSLDSMIYIRHSPARRC